MPGYSSPSLTELGSVADFTNEDRFAIDFDGNLLRGDHKGTPSS